MADVDDGAAGVVASKPDSETEGSPSRTRRRAVRRTGPPQAETSDQPAVHIEKAKTTQPKALSSSDTAPTGEAEGLDTPSKTEEPGSTDLLVVPESRSKLGKRAFVTVVITVVLVVALLGAGIFLLVKNHSATERTAERNAIVDAANTTVLNLTTIHPETAKENVDRILSNATGEFRDEFDGRQDPFVSVVVDAGVKTDGQIIESGLESQNELSSTVLVAARAMVSSVDKPDPEPRDFRMRVTVVEVDGNLMTSKVEFVP